jgi:hypothetical protein
MSNWKEKAKEAQGQESNYPQFLKTIDLHLTVRTDPKGKACFSFWNKEKGERVFSAKPIEGVLIGSAMRMSGYDRNLGANGSTINSSIFYTYGDPTVAFAMGSVAKRGTASEIQQYIENETGGTVKKRRVLFIKTLSGSLVEIETNMSLSITEMNNLNTLDNFVIAEPKIYDADDFDKKTNKYLGSLAKSNPPKYAHLVNGDAITDEFANEVDLGNIFDEYIAFEKFTRTAGDTQEGKPEPIQEEPELEENSGLPF